MQSTTSVSSAMQQNSRRALKTVAFALTVVVYLAGLAYAAVRSYSLFSATIAPELLPLAVLGIIALEVTALALPLTIQYWAAPGAQKMAAKCFYYADLTLIIGNAILDAAHHSGALLPGFLQAYGVFAVPGLPVFCMAGVSLLWTLDPSSREADMIETVKSATHEALLAQIAKATESVDISEQVAEAAGEAARALVSETLGRAPKRKPAEVPAYRYNAPGELPPAVRAAVADIESRPDDMPTGGYPSVPESARRNGHKAAEADPSPKA
jgi:hypothetical protein